MHVLVLVFIGGGLGSLARYLLSVTFNQPIMPWGTLGSNVISCLILGIFMGFAHKSIVSDPHRLFFMTGFCGGFSTFSTYSGELVSIYQGGAPYHAAAYLIVSVVAGILAIIAGILLAKLFY